MAEIHDRATITPSKVGLLQSWIGTQRWFAGKGRDPQLTRLGGYRFDDPGGEVGVEVNLVVDSSSGSDVLYQVPLTYRAGPLAGAEHALLGKVEHSELGTRWVYDGCHDPVFAATLLHAIATGGRQADLVMASTHELAPPTVTARGSGSPDSPAPRVSASRVLSGEQSNTSVVCELEGSTPVILKVFRVLHSGANPDVELPVVLTAAGSTRVPAVVGSLGGTWPDREGSDPVSGHLALAQEFLPGVRDAWREALVAAEADRDFTVPARALGTVTAQVHQTLASALPTVPADGEQKALLVGRLRARLADATAALPSLADHAAAVERVYAAAEAAEWPALQRVHGDFHLGQVLDAPGRGWVLLDFEGEPLRPLAERSGPDLALRDVAGLLRSLDYAAGSVAHHHGLDRTAWARSARTAFLDGYAEAAGRDPRDDHGILDALELDKALYEVVYEARNRPSWITIPTTAIARLVAGSRS